MNPKKPRDLILEVSAETELPIHLIEAATKFYWREVWENLTSLSSPKIHVENLGDFNIKHWLLDKEIRKCEIFEVHTDEAKKKRYLSGISIKDRIILLENIKKEIQEENQRKDFIYEHKKITKLSEADMDQQKGNIPGDLL